MNREKVQGIIKENEKHYQALFSEYDPVTGVGSPIRRVKLVLSKDGQKESSILLPYYVAKAEIISDILENYESVEEYLRFHNEVSKEDMYNALTSMRIKYDFEYWAATCAIIFDKATSQEVLFRLRKAQRKLLKVLVETLFDNKPVRIILLKARQWGGSTLVQLFMAWIQLFHRKNWNSVIAAHIEEAARNIRSMYTLMAERHPESVLPVKMKPFEGSSKNRLIVDRGAVIYIGSMERPNNLHSGNYKLVHCSEVGYWKATQQRKPSDFVNAFAGSVPLEPFTVVALEATAKGTGNFFHTTWQGAVRGENAYTPIFVAWWEIDMYSKAFKSEEEKVQFVSTMTQREEYMFSLGATLEGLNWYREKRGDFENDWDMQEQFPSTPEEAFVTSGQKAHHPLYIKQMERFARQPKYIGEMIADSRRGDEAINASLKFVERANGEFWIWSLPEEDKYENRYIVSLDIGGSSPKADWSVIRVLDRLKMKDGGVPEFVATYRFHMDQDLTAWRAVQVAKFYNNALLVVERNSLKRKETEGNYTLTVLDEISHSYSKIYYRDDPDKIKEGLPPRYGFFTDRNNKELIVSAMNRGLRDIGFIERDQRMLDECGFYELKTDGSYGAIDGQHDDIYMSSGIALYVSENWPLPYEIQQANINMSQPRIRTEASM